MKCGGSAHIAMVQWSGERLRLELDYFEIEFVLA
jgi:hypothetical protein